MKASLALLLTVAALPLFAAEHVTFTEHIAPIVYNRCASCHRPGEAAPFSLLTYEDVSKRGKLITAVTASRYMPPWHAEPASYDYKDSRRLTDSELKTIQTWVKDGMPKGDMAKLPALPKFPEGWQLGQPDMVVKMPKGFKVPAEGADIYRYERIPLNLPDDMWVRAIELRPSARTVVHHVLYFAEPTESAVKVQTEQDALAKPGAGMKFRPDMSPMGGVAVGAQPHLLPEGLAIKLPKNSDLMFQYHYHPVGKEETEQSTVGLYLAKKAPERHMTGIMLPVSYSIFSGLNIPAGKKDFSIKDSFTLPVDIEAISVGAHAHYIGKTMKMTATLPDGTVKTLLDIKNWDFAWQDRYFFDQFVGLPKGTRLDSEVTWDNSEDNPKNPSRPAINLRWGEQTKDEMGSVSLQVVAKNEADLPALQQALRQHTLQTAQKRIMTEPGFLSWLRQEFGDVLPKMGGGQ